MAQKVVCARYLYDGCKSIDDMVKALEEQIKELREMKTNGWELEAVVANDRGVLVNANESGEDAPWWSAIDDRYFESKK